MNITREYKNEAGLRNNYCSGEAISIIYCECVFVATGTQRDMSMRYIIICVLSSSTTFFHMISKMARLSEEKSSKIKCVF